MRAILQQSWKTYCQHFPLILAVVVTVWTPLELLCSYMDAFVFGKADFQRSWRFAQLLDDFVGSIATAGVIFIGHEALTGRQATFRSAFGAGFRSLWRLWWTRFLTGLALAVGLIMLIFPGVYLLVRLSLVEPVAVQERISGAAAMHRSFELTEGRFWFVFRLGLVLLCVFTVPILLILGTAYVPELDHWLIDAMFQLVGDVVAALGTIVLLTTYSHLNNERTTA